MARRLIGTGVTNSQGIAIMNKDANGNTISGYTGVGAGKLQIVAESGTLQSETYEILDCIFLDRGTSNTSSNYTKINCSLTLNNGAMVITRTADGECYIEFEPTGTVLSEYLGKTIRVDCDVEADQNVQIMVFQQVGSYQQKNSAPAKTGTLTVPTSSTEGLSIDSSATRLRFRLQCGSLNMNETCRFTNLKIYLV